MTLLVLAVAAVVVGIVAAAVSDAVAAIHDDAGRTQTESNHSHCHSCNLSVRALVHSARVDFVETTTTTIRGEHGRTWEQHTTALVE